MSEPFDPQSQIEIDNSRYYKINESYYHTLEASIDRGEITLYIEDPDDGVVFTLAPNDARALAEWLQGAATWRGLSES